MNTCESSNPSAMAGADAGSGAAMGRRRVGVAAAVTAVVGRLVGGPMMRDAGAGVELAGAGGCGLGGAAVSAVGEVWSGAADRGGRGVMAVGQSGVASPVASIVTSPVVTLASVAAGMPVRGKPVDAFADRRRRYLAMLRVLGFEREFAALPELFQKFIWSRKVPDPAIVFEASFPSGRTWRVARRAVEKAFRDASFELIEGSGKRITWREYCAIIPALLEVVQLEPSLPQRAPVLTQFCDAIRDRLLAIVNDSVDRVGLETARAINTPLVMHSRCDTKMLISQLVLQRNARGKLESRVIVSAAEPQVREISLDGIPRRMYRVARSFAAIHWISWKGSHLQLTGAAAEQEYPVYVQSHAMVQLYDRLDDPSARPFLDCWLAESLENPVIVDRRGRELLVEFRLCEQRVGYLIVTPVHEAKAVAVRTFLFLTMEQTPEAQQLARRLKLRRDDLDWLRLQTLSGFTRTDVGNDPALRAKLDACGCGHLFELRDANYTPVEGSAAALRKYLRLAA